MFQVQVFGCDEIDEALNVAPSDRSKCLFRKVYDDGVAGMFDTLSAIRQKVHEDAAEEYKLEAQDAKLLEAEKKKFGTADAERREDARLFRRHQGFNIIAGGPPWQGLLGFSPKSEHLVHPHARAKQIRGLLSGVEKMLRVEIANAAGDGEKRSKFWDPLRSVCVQLGISQSLLSRYSKEITGISATEMVDSIRAEEVRGKMKAFLKTFVVEFFSRKDAKTQRTATAKSTTEDTEDTEEGLGEQIWEALRKTRKAPRWHRTEWALSLGFSSYSRLFRACLICFGKTPHQIEMEIIEELLRTEFRNCERNGDGKGNGGHEGREDELKEHEEGKDVDVVKRE